MTLLKRQFPKKSIWHTVHCLGTGASEEDRQSTRGRDTPDLEKYDLYKYIIAYMLNNDLAY